MEDIDRRKKIEEVIYLVEKGMTLKKATKKVGLYSNIYKYITQQERLLLESYRYINIDPDSQMKNFYCPDLESPRVNNDKTIKDFNKTEEFLKKQQIKKNKNK
jgi:hypothetical protein